MPNNGRTIIEFRCPQCRGNSVCEVSTAMNYAWVSEFVRYDHNGIWFPDYYDGDTEVLDSIRHECSECGFTVCEGYPAPNLGAYLIEQGWIAPHDEMETPFEEPDEPNWEV